MVHHAKNGSWIAIVIVLFICSPSLLLADEASAPAVQGNQPDASEPAGAIQERAIRQGAGSGQGAQCVCERALGQCVVNAFGCVPHPGNPCNGGCVMKQPNSLGGASLAPSMTAPQRGVAPAPGSR
jgi:hypothetical protein